MVFPYLPTATHKLFPYATPNPIESKTVEPRPVHEVPFVLVAMLFPPEPTAIDKGTLTINAHQEGSNIVVSITDTGTGIPPEIIHKIFEPFFTTKPTGEGSGLGLDIVKKIIEKHQGIIDVESVPGQTKFTVSLPINL